MRKRIKNNQEGMTLVEFLVLAFVLITISGIITGIVVSVLRGSSRAFHSSEVSSNGNFALSVISTLLSTATRVEAIDSTEVNNCTSGITGQSISFRTTDGGLTTLACIDDTIASNSSPLINPIKLRVDPTTCNFTCTQENSFDNPLVSVEFIIESRTFDFETDQTVKRFQTSVAMRNYEF